MVGFWIGVGSFLLGLGMRLQGLKAILGLGGLVYALLTIFVPSRLTGITVSGVLQGYFRADELTS